MVTLLPSNTYGHREVPLASSTSYKIVKQNDLPGSVCLFMIVISLLLNGKLFGIQLLFDRLWHLRSSKHHKEKTHFSFSFSFFFPCFFPFLQWIAPSFVSLDASALWSGHYSYSFCFYPSSSDGVKQPFEVLGV